MLRSVDCVLDDAIVHVSGVFRGRVILVGGFTHENVFHSIEQHPV